MIRKIVSIEKSAGIKAFTHFAHGNT